MRDGGLRGVCRAAAGRVGLAHAAELPPLPPPFACLSRPLFAGRPLPLFCCCVITLWEAAPHRHLTPAVGGLPPSARPRLLARGAPLELRVVHPPCCPSRACMRARARCAPPAPVACPLCGLRRCACASRGSWGATTTWAGRWGGRGWEGAGSLAEALHARRRRARLLRYGCACAAHVCAGTWRVNALSPCANCSLQVQRVHSLRTSSESKPAGATAPGCTFRAARGAPPLRPSAHPRSTAGGSALPT